MSETLPLFSGGEADAPEPAVSELARKVETVLNGQPGPWTAAQIRKQWPAKPVPKTAQIEAVLAELEARRSAHRLAGGRGAVLWSARPMEAWLDEAERRMLEMAEAAGGPVPEKKLLGGAWPKALEAAPVLERLRRLEQTGRLKRWQGKTPAWWRLAPEEALGAVLEETLGRRALPKAQWLREGKARLRGPSAAQWQQAGADLIASGRVVSHATRIAGKRVEVCVRAECRAALLEIYRPVIESLKEEWRRLGIREAEVARFLSGGGSPGAEVLLAELERLEKEHAPPNSVARLRRRMAPLGWTKEEFDAAALELLRQGRVYMAPHDHPMRLPEEERIGLVGDGRGNFYVSISSRA